MWEESLPEPLEGTEEVSHFSFSNRVEKLNVCLDLWELWDWCCSSTCIVCEEYSCSPPGSK
jgi:hypothetical protein